MYTNLGKANNVGELISILEKLSNETKVVAMGAECHVMFNGNLKTVIFDEDDLAEEWNEEFPEEV